MTEQCSDSIITSSSTHGKDTVLPRRNTWTTKSIYRNLFVNTEMESWVERQKPQTQDKFRKVSVVVLSDTNFWKNLDIIVLKNL